MPASGMSCALLQEAPTMAVYGFGVGVAIANNFGRGTLFGIGLLVLGIIFYPILAFGDAQYQPGSSG